VALVAATVLAEATVGRNSQSARQKSRIENGCKDALWRIPRYAWSWRNTPKGRDMTHEHVDRTAWRALLAIPPYDAPRNFTKLYIADKHPKNESLISVCVARAQRRRPPCLTRPSHRKTPPSPRAAVACGQSGSSCSLSPPD